MAGGDLEESAGLNTLTEEGWSYKGPEENE
jgi:hypothetical protein